MPEGIDHAASAFERAIDPAPSPSESTPGQRQPATRARDVEAAVTPRSPRSQSLFSRSGWSRAIRKPATRATPVTILAFANARGRLQMVGLTRGKSGKVASGKPLRNARRTTVAMPPPTKPMDDAADDQPGDEEADAAGDEADEDAQYRNNRRRCAANRFARRAPRRLYSHRDVPLAAEQGQRAQASRRPRESARRADARSCTSTA